MMSLALRIKDSRKRRGYTQKDLADLVSVKPATVSSWEVGRNEPSIDMLKKLANILGVSFEYLTGTIDSSENSNKPLSRNQKLVAYSIDPDISDEERNDIIEMVKIAMKNRRRV